MSVKPRISYIDRASLPNIPSLNVSLVRKRDRNWESKTELTDFIDTLTPYPESDTYLYARCHCSAEYQYADKNSVPSSNVTCACGRKILEYGV